jgi:hypothetical protein
MPITYAYDVWHDVQELMTIFKPKYMLETLKL